MDTGTVFLPHPRPYRYLSDRNQIVSVKESVSVEIVHDFYCYGRSQLTRSLWEVRINVVILATTHQRR